MNTTHTEEKLVNILNEMSEYLNVPQMKKLQEVLLKNLAENAAERKQIPNEEYLRLFLEAKKIEGCSEPLAERRRLRISQCCLEIA